MAQEKQAIKERVEEARSFIAAVLPNVLGLFFFISLFRIAYSLIFNRENFIGDVKTSLFLFLSVIVSFGLSYILFPRKDIAAKKEEQLIDKTQSEDEHAIIDVTKKRTQPHPSQKRKELFIMLSACCFALLISTACLSYIAYHQNNRLSDIAAQVEKREEEIAILSDRNKTLHQENKDLLSKNAGLVSENAELKKSSHKSFLSGREKGFKVGYDFLRKTFIEKGVISSDFPTSLEMYKHFRLPELKPVQ